METPKEENCEPTTETPRDDCGPTYYTAETREENCEPTFYTMEAPKDWQATTDLGDPTYWLSYEYKQIQVECKNLMRKWT